MILVEFEDTRHWNWDKQISTSYASLHKQHLNIIFSFSNLTGETCVMITYNFYTCNDENEQEVYHMMMIRWTLFCFIDTFEKTKSFIFWYKNDFRSWGNHNVKKQFKYLGKVKFSFSEWNFFLEMKCNLATLGTYKLIILIIVFHDDK